MADDAQTRRLATIVALDVAGYSARTEADEARTTAEVAALRKVIEGIAAKHGGRVFNTAGDGFMLEFGSSLAAVEAAFALAETCEPKVRVGVHLGDVIVQSSGDLLGHGVNVAARLMAMSDPGGALVSAAVRQTIRGPLAERLQSRGLHKLSKMTEAIEAFVLKSASGTPPAPDVFLAFAREDHAAAAKFAAAFERAGLSASWDMPSRSGDAIDEVTERALKAAKAVVVLWSKNSVESRWIRSEATLADRNKTLVPCMIEPCERPIMFELAQTAELSHWQGDASDEAWVALLTDVRRLVAKEVATVAVPTAPPPAQAVAVSTQSATRMARPVLAVLPFINRSGLKEDDIFAFGMVEDIIDALSLSRTIRVLSSGATAAYRKNAVDIVEIARKSNVRYLLEGNIRRVGKTLRVTAQLIDATDGTILWTQRFDRPLSELAALQEDLVVEVASNLGSQISRLEMERALKKPRDLTAWEASLRSTVAATRGDWVRAISEGERAVAVAPDSAAAHATLAFALSGMVAARPAEPQWRERSHQHIARALELDASNPTVHLWVGWSYAWCCQPEEGLPYLEQAVRARPTNAVARHGLGSAYILLNRNEEALAEWETAERLAPNSPNQYNLSTFIGAALLKLGNLEAALERFEHASRLVPTFSMAHLFGALTLKRLGRSEAALAEMSRAMGIDPDPTAGRADLRFFLELWWQNHPDLPVMLNALQDLQDLWNATATDPLRPMSQ